MRRTEPGKTWIREGTDMKGAPVTARFRIGRTGTFHGNGNMGRKPVMGTGNDVMYVIAM